MRALPILFLLSLAACAADVGADKPHAQVQPVPVVPIAPVQPIAPVTGASAAQPATTTLPIDRAQSRVHAKAAKVTRSHEIDFSDFAGTVGMSGETVASIAFTVQVASLATDPAKLTNHLKTDDFLAVEKFPTATFTSTEIRPEAGAAGATHAISGDLTIHGVTKRVSFPAKLDVSPTAVKGHAEFSIDRKDFGVVFPGMPDDLIQDTVLLTLDMTAPRGA